MEKKNTKKTISVFVVTSLEGGVEGVYYNKRKADSEAKGIEQDLLFGGHLMPRVKVKKFKVK
jgi:hypothetical protein